MILTSELLAQHPFSGEIHNIYTNDWMLLVRHFNYCCNLQEPRFVELAQPEKLFLMKYKSKTKINYNPSNLLLSTTRDVDCKWS